MLHDDHVAVAVLPAGELDRAVRGGVDRRARGRGVVHALVARPGLVDGMQAHAERRADAAELQGGAQERAAQAGAVEVVVLPPLMNSRASTRPAPA
ncbi:hypothetical protein G6F50_015435 [Rhizopus delemar]|uniref:Uncharacterized protein n=1 Tax=Rhizopus delemar TaxID=936053 RepID=A0A9P6XYG1_9FUNG|nr:hypothetical protein G6F50_015435 [Rhizopus delemar]